MKTLTTFVIGLTLLLTSVSLFADNLFVLNSISQTISSIDLTSQLVNNTFSTTGSYANKLAIKGNLGYVVNSGDNAIGVINLESGSLIRQIQLENSSNPYDILINNNFAYVTGLFTNKVYKINLTTNLVEGSCAVGTAPEGMLIFNNKLYVANCYLVYPNYEDASLSVIDLSSFTVATTIPVAKDPQCFALSPDNH